MFFLRCGLMHVFPHMSFHETCIYIKMWSMHGIVFCGTICDHPYKIKLLIIERYHSLTHCGIVIASFCVLAIHEYKYCYHTLIL